MPIRFTCPHCGATTNVADEYVGHSGPCAGCGRTVTVGHPGAAPGYAPPAKSPALMIVFVVLALVIGGLLVCGGVMVALFVTRTQSSVQAARQAARRAQCTNNLRQIGLALLNYESTYGCFPPAYVADAQGKRMHSWRVLILPFLEQEALYDRYRFDEPWNSPNNLALAELMPPVYRCPDDVTAAPDQTSYAVIVGSKAGPGRPAAMFHGDQPVKLADVKDGLANTILVAEATGAGINWMEPQDLDFEAMDLTINGAAGSVKGRHPDGANAFFCDGSVHFLPDSLDRETLRRMILCDDGRPVAPSRF